MSYLTGRANQLKAERSICNNKTHRSLFGSNLSYITRGPLRPSQYCVAKTNGDERGGSTSRWATTYSDENGTKRFQPDQGRRTGIKMSCLEQWDIASLQLDRPPSLCDAGTCRANAIEFRQCQLSRKNKDNSKLTMLVVVNIVVSVK